MTYDDALDFWFSHVNYEKNAPRVSDLKLDRIRNLLERLGNPQDRLRIIHVAGSKGKGSTSAMIAAVLQQAGYRTGLFTSPHLCRVEERIQVDRVPIGATELTALAEEIRAVTTGLDKAGLAPSFFEIATALGFLHFARKEVYAAVVEVGLGGRFDSTNVCRPLVTIITSISFDHTEILGNRLASIAMEKAGIIKPGRFAVSGVTVPEAREVVEQTCRDRAAPLDQLGVDFHYRYEAGRVVPHHSPFATHPAHDVRFPRVQVTTARRPWPAMELGLLGEHQAANAAVAVACLERLCDCGLRIDDESVRRGLGGLQWPARLQVFGGQPLVVLDCAHNLASVQALIDTLSTSLPATRRFLIFGASQDKDLSGMLELMAPHFNHAFLTRYYSSTRSVPPEQIATLCASSFAGRLTTCQGPADAWRAAQKVARPDDLVCITGSVFLAGEVLPLLHDRSPLSAS
jgi:dihydrofolate synthase/folylpolyglutamate synthase